MKSRFWKLRRLLCVLSLFASLGALPQGRAATYYISITEYGWFDPDYLEVQVGDTVYWINDDPYELYRTTICSTYPWNSGHIPYGYGVYLVARKTGTFDYYDSVLYEYGTLVIKPYTPPVLVIPPPVTLLNYQLRGDGSFQCTVTNLTVGQPYYIQTSTNLVNWTDTYSTTASATMETYVDSNPASSTTQFYRCYQAPYYQ